ncbi:MAG: hypothetical protein PQJ59_17510 [Spirochaetales bacterium]|nr:hypothetical protein [Spirochaetales bacterium]
MTRERKGVVILIIYCLPLLALTASPVRWGVRSFFSGGYPSGKGLWDWTDAEQEGELHWKGGGGGGLILEIPLKESLSLTADSAYVYARGGQSLDDWDIVYTQQSLELFLLVKGKLPVDFKGSSLAVGLGGMAPFDARMNGVSATPHQPVMLCLKAGLDFPSLKGSWGEGYFSAYFVHPLTSPEYDWVDGSSGSVRINRIDLAVTWLLPGRRGK